MQDLLQRVVDLSTPTQTLCEALSANGHDHELLEVDVVVCMNASVEDVHHRRGKRMSIDASEVLVERKPKGFGCCLRYGK